MRLVAILPALLLCWLPLSVFAQPPVTLSGSPISMDYQYNIALESGFERLMNGWVLADSVNQGVLVEVAGNEDYVLHDVSFPFALPRVKRFVERLAYHYHRIFCGEKLVVTSLSRPIDLQPKNAHYQSIHPAGMAVDLRWPDRPGGGKCNDFLESMLLSLEKYGKIDVTREYRPPHYHIAVLSDDF